MRLLWLSLLLGAVGLALWSLPEDVFWPHRRFDHAAWIALPEKERYRYALDIIDSKLLIGRNEAEIEGMLGRPSSVPEKGIVEYLVKVGSSQLSFDQVFILDVRLDPKTGTCYRTMIRGN